MQSNKKPASKRISARKLVWRSGRDSNPRGIAPKLISSLNPSWFFRVRRGRNRDFRKRGKARYIKAFQTFRPEMTRK